MAMIIKINKDATQDSYEIFYRNLQYCFPAQTMNQEQPISSPEDLNQYSKLPYCFQISFETQKSRTNATVDFLLTKFVYDEFFILY